MARAQMAYVNVFPGTVPTVKCKDASVSPGCPNEVPNEVRSSSLASSSPTSDTPLSGEMLEYGHGIVFDVAGK
jgi:hypothetical protein